MFRAGDKVKVPDGSIRTVVWAVHGKVACDNEKVYVEEDLRLVQQSIFARRVTKPITEMSEDELQRFVEELSFKRRESIRNTSGPAPKQRKKELKATQKPIDLGSLEGILSPDKIEDLKKMILEKRGGEQVERGKQGSV